MFATPLLGGGVRIIAKPNAMAALLLRYAKERRRYGLKPDVIQWTPRMLPRLQWQLLAGEADDLLRWLANQPASWPVRRLFIRVREARLAYLKGLHGCTPC